MLKADLHIHTCYSFDSSMSLERVIERCVEVGIDCLAITDHNTIAGALKMREIAPFTVIVGEEILTAEGEIIGLFLTEEIPSGLPPQEVVTRIKAQGGLVCIPHPFDPLRPSAMRDHAVEALLTQIDIIEVFNSRTALSASSKKAHRFAQTHGLPASAGSDAHTLGEIGDAYVEMPPFNGREEFLSALAHGKITGHRAYPWVHIFSAWARLKKKLRQEKKGV
jgi:hypothetical protein